MNTDEEIIMKTTKEIIIKFIETGRISLTSFEEGFTKVYDVVNSCCKHNQK